MRMNPPPTFPGHQIRSSADYWEYARTMQEEYTRRQGIESGLVPANSQPFDVEGFCAVCNENRKFHVDYLYAYVSVDGLLMPNWREHLICIGCGMSNRVRAVAHFLLQQDPGSDCRIYMTEQKTHLYRWTKARFANTTGSEYMGADVELGSEIQGFRHEDLLRLSFADATFDYVLSFDVLEHVHDVRTAYRECLRVLKPGGVMIATVPFASDCETDVIRAERRPDGTIHHLLPPQYHGNPIDPEKGSLCFRLFGWQLLRDLQETGFEDPRAVFYWSRELSYLGSDQILFVASKPTR